MIAIERLKNLSNWLKRGKVSSWRIRRRDCLHCSGRFSLFVTDKPIDIRCLGCGLTATATALLPVVREHIEATEVKDMWEMSTYGAPAKLCRRMGISSVETEFIEGHPSGSVVDGIRCEDVTDTSFPDESLDLITSNQVFEHVEHDIRGYKECFRILRPGGALFFAVPMKNITASKRIAKFEEGKLIFCGRPEFHGSRITGPRSVPTFWHFSKNDLLARVGKAGFETAWRAVEPANNNQNKTLVVYARKPRI